VAFDVLRHPTVASKRFLVTIGDRTVGGLSHRDPMVGPWQVPVADCAVTLADFAGWRRGDGMGERTPLAALDAPASGRMAVGEAITNLLAAPIELSRVKLSCQLDGRLRRAGRRRGAVRHRARRRPGAVPGAGHRHPGGQGFAVDAHALAGRRPAAKQVTAPVSLIVTAFATLADVRGTLTPQLQPRRHHADPGRPRPGPRRMAGSMLAQVLGQFGDRVPDLDDPRR
jgi:phosphoribosylformylglycinamidine synthase